MATTPNMSVTLLESSQSQKEITINEALYRFDALLNNRLLDKDLSTPPISPNEGDSYIIGENATDAWEGHEHEIAYFQQIWRFITPSEGLLLWVADEAQHYLYNGVAWVVYASGDGQGTPNFAGTSFKNVLINGDFELWQRGNNFNHFSMRYVADRWIMDRASSGNVMIRSEIANMPDGFRKAIHIQRNYGDSILHPIRLEQSVEARNATRLQGQDVTLSFYIKMGVDFDASLFTVDLLGGTGDDELALAGGFTGETTLANASPNHSTSWQRVSLTAAVADNISQFAVRFTYNPSVVAPTEDWFEITGVQLEAASIATNYEFLDYSIALIRAQRYYEKSFAPENPPIRNSGDIANAARMPQLVGASQGMYAEISFTVEKRSAPSIEFYNPSANNARMRNRVTNADCASTTALDIGTKGFAPFGFTPASSGAGQQLIVHYSADAEIY